MFNSYSMILHRGTRQSLGIDVKDSVVILDEAHNIIEVSQKLHFERRVSFAFEISGTSLMNVECCRGSPSTAPTAAV